jgi:selenocysteine lyase/cysteine desulfurase
MLEAGVDAIGRQEQAHFRPLLGELLEMDHVTVHGPHDFDARTPTVCFSVAGHAADAVAAHLASRRVAVWSGNYYAVETMAALGLPDGAIRAGVSCYTTDVAVTRLLDGVRELA